MQYFEFAVASNFSFLRGASHPHELVQQAEQFCLAAIGIADRNTLAGVVRMHSACSTLGLKPLIGCRLDLIDAPSLLAYPINREGYGLLSRLSLASVLLPSETSGQQPLGRHRPRMRTIQ